MEIAHCRLSRLSEQWSKMFLSKKKFSSINLTKGTKINNETNHLQYICKLETNFLNIEFLIRNFMENSIM